MQLTSVLGLFGHQHLCVFVRLDSVAPRHVPAIALVLDLHGREPTPAAPNGRDPKRNNRNQKKNEGWIANRTNGEWEKNLVARTSQVP